VVLLVLCTSAVTLGKVKEVAMVEAVDTDANPSQYFQNNKHRLLKSKMLYK